MAWQNYPRRHLRRSHQSKKHEKHAKNPMLAFTVLRYTHEMA